MNKYTHLSPREAGKEFHRIFAAKDANAMEQFIFDHHLDEQNCIYNIGYDRIPHGDRVTHKFTVRLADANDKVHTYVVEKNLAAHAGGGSCTVVYEINPFTKFKRGDVLVVRDTTDER